ncbi:MAG: saccharopine dehydrogenase family protein [Longimicrobiales bacterium]
MKTLLLGAGRVGTAIARDLATGEGFDLTVADSDREALDRLRELRDVWRVTLDASDPAALGRLVNAHELVIGAMPGHLGYETAKRVIEAGRPLVDISFFEQDALSLDAVAKEKGVVAIVDCGVAPGCSNLILGRLEAALEKTNRFECVVGGLPAERSWPWEYKAPFSPVDVIEEYTRPARLRRDGRDVVMPALSEIELVEFPGVGTLEAFNTDGLRTLLKTCRTPTMIEKTMRYPGHAERMRALRNAGFFGRRALDVAGVSIRPIDLTARLLFEQWRFEPGESDLMAMRVIVEGTDGGGPVTHTYTLLDRYDAETQTTAMARTTGYTCTAMARLVASGRWTQPGVAPPEIIGRDEACFEFVMQHLGERGVVFRHEQN